MISYYKFRNPLLQIASVVQLAFFKTLVQQFKMFKVALRSLIFPTKFLKNFGFSYDKFLELKKTANLQKLSQKG